MPKLLLVFFAFVSLFEPQAARPCSQFRTCVETLPAGGEIPANLPGMTWTYGLGLHGTPILELPAPRVTEVLPDGTASELPTEFTLVDGVPILRFARLLVPGARYQVEVTHECSRWGNESAPLDVHTTTLIAGPEAPIPDTLGTLTVSESRQVMADAWTSLGSCTNEAEVVTRDLALEVSDEARPWVRALKLTWSSAKLYQLSDLGYWDEQQSDPSPEDAWQELIHLEPYHICHSDEPGQDNPMDEGTHTVSLNAEIPGSDHVVASATATFDLVCEAAGSADDDGADVVEAVETSAPRADSDGCRIGLTPSLAIALFGLLVLMKRRDKSAREKRLFGIALRSR